MPNQKTSKRIRRELTASENLSSQNAGGIPYAFQTSQVIYQGPLPEPEMLEKYKNADSSFPERIMRMAEAHNAADIKTKNRISLSNLIVPITGQVFTLLLGIASIVACIFLAKNGYSAGAIAVIAGGFSPMVINAFKGLRQNKLSRP
jgi:uncharacterized membrane protein